MRSNEVGLPCKEGLAIVPLHDPCSLKQLLHIVPAAWNMSGVVSVACYMKGDQMEPEREDRAKRRQSSSKVMLSQTRRTLENELLTGGGGGREDARKEGRRHV
ncbi:hypothetical protein C4D60_Mb10t15740 [Musa balbisiana]|uniref:Uncharacterized protein n=1 Tax=Musa balbisiana TaxID=52838 RepID=A0A4S8IXH5_MUSBA|nr:hypothetical protein C4D60_Mb10t15740 [Musa balbisiana]